jgi:hypothetical protein
MSAVGPPEDEEDILHGGEAAGVAITPVLLGLAVLRDGVAVEPLEHVALLEGVVDRRFVVGTWLLQHVVENPRASRVRSRAPLSRVNSKGFVTTVVVPLLARLVARLLSLLAPFALLMGLLGLAALRGRIVHAFALFAVEDRPTASSPEAKLVAMSNSSFESTGGLRLSSRTRSRHVVPSRKACTISDCATLGSSIQSLEKRRMKSRSNSPDFWVQEHRSQKFPGHTYVHWKFHMNVRTRLSQLWIWLAGRCSSHVRAELVRCRGRLRMITSSLVAPPS